MAQWGGTKWQQQQNGSLGHFKSPVGRNLLTLPKKKKSTPLIAGPIENLVKDACIILGLKAECVRPPVMNHYILLSKVVMQSFTLFTCSSRLNT
jgi:hypothetical protein